MGSLKIGAKGERGGERTEVGCTSVMCAYNAHMCIIWDCIRGPFLASTSSALLLHQCLPCTGYKEIGLMLQDLGFRTILRVEEI